MFDPLALDPLALWGALHFVAPLALVALPAVGALWWWWRPRVAEVTVASTFLWRRLPPASPRGGRSIAALVALVAIVLATSRPYLAHDGDLELPQRR